MLECFECLLLKGLKKLLIIGGGFGGCTVVHEYSKKENWEITLVEPNAELGGGVRTRFKSDILIHLDPDIFLHKRVRV